MDSLTLEALLNSVLHWSDNEHVLRHSEASTSDKDCALCGIFMPKYCVGCPVSERTNAPVCQNSPYLHAYNKLVAWRYGTPNLHPWLDTWRSREDFHLAARDERLFLESLLPQG